MGLKKNRATTSNHPFRHLCAAFVTVATLAPANALATATYSAYADAFLSVVSTEIFTPGVDLNYTDLLTTGNATASIDIEQIDADALGTFQALGVSGSATPTSAGSLSFAERDTSTLLHFENQTSLPVDIDILFGYFAEVETALDDVINEFVGAGAHITLGISAFNASTFSFIDQTLVDYSIELLTEGLEGTLDSYTDTLTLAPSIIVPGNPSRNVYSTIGFYVDVDVDGIAGAVRPTQVPLPATLVLFGMGLLGIMRRRRLTH